MAAAIAVIINSMSFKDFFKKEATFCIAFFAAVISAFIVPPSAAYAKYIDLHVLFVLFSLMLVVAGLRSCGVFDTCADFLCSRVKRLRTLCAVLVYLCFFFSMFITNDVSLLTFVPFAVLLLNRSGNGKYIIYVVVLQTLAANLGSMLTPMGNPQNLFLYTRMGISASEFCSILIPYVVISGVLLALCLLFIQDADLESVRGSMPQTESAAQTNNPAAGGKIHLAVFWSLFVLCILCVLKVIPGWVLAATCAVAVLIVQRSLFLKVDYMLLLTFCAFFVFTGNMGNVPAIKTFLQKAVQGHEFWAGLLSSQVISNVPSALLLYPFSSDLKGLLLGVDVGGLGTLVASLASLISYKLYVNQEKPAVPVKAGQYLAVFTVMNAVFMIILCAYFVIF